MRAEEGRGVGKSGRRAAAFSELPIYGMERWGDLFSPGRPLP